LINEAYLRLVAQRERELVNRSHFVAVAAHVMRQVLVDFARHAKAAKRGFGVAPGPLEESAAVTIENPETVLALDAALTRLAGMDERQARIVELRYFAGLSIDEAAGVMEVSPRTIKREWTSARAWLRGELGASDIHSGAVRE
jgi:RNA polymerase sigma factor (TIGR02999 family)